MRWRRDVGALHAGDGPFCQIVVEKNQVWTFTVDHEFSFIIHLHIFEHEGSREPVERTVVVEVWGTNRAGIPCLFNHGFDARDVLHVPLVAGMALGIDVHPMAIWTRATHVFFEQSSEFLQVLL